MIARILFLALVLSAFVGCGVLVREAANFGAVQFRDVLVQAQR